METLDACPYFRTLDATSYTSTSHSLKWSCNVAVVQFSEYL